MSFNFGWYYQPQGGGGSCALAASINISLGGCIIWDIYPQEYGGMYVFNGGNDRLYIQPNGGSAQFYSSNTIYSIPLGPITQDAPYRAKWVYDPSDTGAELKYYSDPDLGGFAFRGSVSIPTPVAFTNGLPLNTDAQVTRIQVYDADPDSGGTLLNDFDCNFVRNAANTAYVSRGDATAETGSDKIIYDVVGNNRLTAQVAGFFSQRSAITSVNGSSSSISLEAGVNNNTINFGGFSTTTSLTFSDSRAKTLTLPFVDNGNGTGSFDVPALGDVVNFVDFGTVTLSLNGADVNSNPLTETINATLNLPSPYTTVTLTGIINSGSASVSFGWTEQPTAGDQYAFDPNFVTINTDNTYSINTVADPWQFDCFIVDDAGMQEFAFTSEGQSTADTTPPVITILGDNPATITEGSTYNDAGATATDDTDGDITANISVTNNVNTSAVGSYTVTYDVSDAAGNNTQATRTVNVEEAFPVLYSPRHFTTFNSTAQMYGEFSSPITLSGDFEISVFASTNNTGLVTVLGQDAFFDNYILLDGGVLKVRLGGGSVLTFTAAGVLNDNVVHEIKVKRTSGVVTSAVDGVGYAEDGGGLSSSTVTFSAIGTAGGGSYFNGILSDLKIIDNGTTVFDAAIDKPIDPQDNIVENDAASTPYLTIYNSAIDGSSSEEFAYDSVDEYWVGDEYWVSPFTDTSSGAWTNEGGGVFRLDGSQGTLTLRPNPAIADGIYSMRFSLSGVGGGGVRLSSDSSTDYTQDGDYDAILTNYTTDIGFRRILSSSVGVVSNISVKRILEMGFDADVIYVDGGGIAFPITKAITSSIIKPIVR